MTPPEKRMRSDPRSTCRDEAPATSVRDRACGRAPGSAEYTELSNQSMASGGDHWQRYFKPTGLLSSVCIHGLTERRRPLISSNVATCAA